MNSKENHPYDPEATVAQAVAELERRGFTKHEIAEALNELWVEVSREAYHKRTRKT